MTDWRDATGFEHVSAAVRRLKERADWAIAERNEQEGAAVHEELVRAEHRLRMCQRAEKRRVK